MTTVALEGLKTRAQRPTKWFLPKPGKQDGPEQATDFAKFIVSSVRQMGSLSNMSLKEEKEKSRAIFSEIPVFKGLERNYIIKKFFNPSLKKNLNDNKFKFYYG